MRGRGLSTLPWCPKELAQPREGVGPFLPTRVAPLFGSRGVAKLVRSTAACGEMGAPATPSACAWLLAIFRQLTATWHT